MQAQITKFIRSKASILGVESGEDSAVVGGKKKELRLLDYACGTGLVSAVSPQGFISFHSYPVDSLAGRAWTCKGWRGRRERMG